MRDSENILKSLALAGVEWELDEPGSKSAPPESAVRAGKSTNARAAAAAEAPRFSAPIAAKPLSNAAVLEIARRLAAADDIFGAIESFREHPLFSGAKNTVPPQIPNGAPGGQCEVPLLVVADIPSLADDACGRILSGAEGELFDKMISAVGFSRGDIAITPLVFWRPAGGRAPGADELAFCRPFVGRIVAMTRPKKILTLGALAAMEIAGASLPRDHGKVKGSIVDSPKSMDVIPIYKPDFILANPAVKKDVWEALKGLVS
ncbi:MAG: uracil-DNA glycosylase, partial [Rickettsiales bacterium]|nr:uracil-DNA glycosylase [Rickettsiales bacterium]